MSLEPSTAKKCKSNYNDAITQEVSQPAPPTIDRLIVEATIPGAVNGTNESDQILAQRNAEVEQIAKIKEQIAEQAKKIAELDKLLYKNSVGSMFYDKDSPSSKNKPAEIVGPKSTNSYPKYLEVNAETKDFKVHYLKQVLSNELKDKFNEKPRVYRVGSEGRTLASASDFRYCLNAIMYDATVICNDMMDASAKEHGVPQPKVHLDVQYASRWFTNVMDHVVVCDRETRTPILAVEPNTFSNEE